MNERDPITEQRRRAAAAISRRSMFVILPGMLLVTVGIAIGASTSSWVTITVTLIGMLYIAAGTAWISHQAQKAFRQRETGRPRPPSP